MNREKKQIGNGEKHNINFELTRDQLRELIRSKFERHNLLDQLSRREALLVESRKYRKV